MSRPKPYDAAIDAAFQLGQTDPAAARATVRALGYDPNVIPENGGIKPKTRFCSHFGNNVRTFRSYLKMAVQSHCGEEQCKIQV